MKAQPTVLALGLAVCAPLAAAAPVPLIRVAHDGTRHGLILRLPDRPSSQLPPPPEAPVVDVGSFYEDRKEQQSLIVIDNKPVTPSAIASPQDALEAPRPLHTTYLWLLSKHPRPDHEQEAHATEDEDKALAVPETVGPTSYARIEAGLIDFYPDRLKMPSWRVVPIEGHDGVARHHQHGVVVVGFVVSLLLVLLMVETWAALSEQVRRVLGREGAIRLEDVDVIVFGSPRSFRGDSAPEREAPQEPSLNEKGVV